MNTLSMRPCVPRQSDPCAVARLAASSTQSRLRRLWAWALATALSLASSFAQTTFVATLDGSQEVPANDSGANGYGRVTLNAAQEVITVDLGWNALAGAAVGAHVHGPAGRGTNADIVFSMGPIPSGTNVASISRSFPITPEQVAQLQAGLFYLNLHSSVFPDGEIRGQIVACVSNALVLNTNDAGPGSLRWAIAEVCPGGTITFDPSLRGQTITLTTGTLQVNRDLRILGPGADQLTVARSPSAEIREFRVMSVFGGVSVRIIGLTIANGRLSTGAGGGLACLDSGLTLEGCVLTANTAVQGGAILNVSGLLRLNECWLTGNAAAGPSCVGGGIENAAARGDAIVELNHTVISSNKTIDVASPFASGGAGISSAAASNFVALVLVNESEIIGNEAIGDGASSFSGVGGGIFNSLFDEFSTNVVVLYRSTVCGNIGRNGGGIATVGGGGQGIFEAVFIDDSTICSNAAGSLDLPSEGVGGGLLNVGSVVMATNVTVSGNSVEGDPEFGGGFGGGICNASIGTTTLVLANCTLTRNTAPTGGALANLGLGDPLEARFQNTIVAGNAATVFLTPNCLNEGGSLISLGHNLEDGTTCSFTNATDLLTTNALLGPLENNGGATLTHALLPGSPAIDAGDPTNAPPADQRGVARPQGAGVDIGAFELVVNRPPVFTLCQSNVTIAAEAGQCAALVAFSVSADGLPAPEVVCQAAGVVIASPHRFPVGVTTVTCTASNEAGTATCEFTVTVVDTEPPAITCPADILVPTDPGRSTARVTWPPPATTDNCEAAVIVQCSPMRGSAFPLGVTTVQCTATDAAGNSASCSFKVTVQGPRDIKQRVLADLMALRAGVNAKPDTKKLDEAIASLRKSLDPALWLDATRLQSKHGDRVFKEEKEAVDKLEDLIKDKKSELDEAVLRNLIAQLVKADRTLATVAIHDALAGGCDRQVLVAAYKHLIKGDSEAAHGKAEKAIDEYRKAWQHAERKALKCDQDDG
jgi:hypothetical protein